MRPAGRSRSLGLLLPVLALLFLLAGCGDDDDGDTEGDAGTETAGSDTGDTEAAAGGNACPADGCTITIAEVAADARSGELVVRFDANFSPDIAGNHFHVYWDTFEADQVSSDAADRGVTQGDWHPTDDAEYVTTEATSVTRRGGSETLCVTAGDRDHAVVDATAVDCVEVTAQLAELSS